LKLLTQAEKATVRLKGHMYPQLKVEKSDGYSGLIQDKIMGYQQLGIL
jgi:hypothetical protein